MAVCVCVYNLSFPGRHILWGVLVGGGGLGRPSSVPVSAEGVLTVAGAVPLQRHRVVV